MTTKLSTGLRNDMLVTDGLRQLLAAGFVKIYAGTEPATADAAIDGGSGLVGKVTVGNDGTTGLTFASTASNGVIQKDASDVWSTTALLSTTMTFFRFCVGADTGSGVSGAGNYRIQGTIGPDMSFDVYRPNPTVTSGDTITLNSFQIQLPLA